MDKKGKDVKSRVSLWDLFITFFKIGAFTFGGCYAMVSVMEEDLAEKKKWITSEELCEYYALGAALPGIIAANTAIFTGRKLLGTKGAIAAVTGMILPAFVAIIFTLYFLRISISTTDFPTHVGGTETSNIEQESPSSM